MKLKNRSSLRWYFHLFNSVASERLKKNDLDQRRIHTLIVVVLSTGLLMWSYAFLAMLTISSPVPGIIGVICAIIHALSPFLFKFTKNASIPTNVLLAAGVIHQGTFSFFSGGFDSNILIWFGIIPMIGGMITGSRGALTWFYITTFIALGFFILQLNHYPFPAVISHEGKVWSQALLVFGWIFLSSMIVIVYAGMTEHTEKLLGFQSKKIDDLFRVLFHDLANPLGRIAIGISIAQRNQPQNENNRGLEIAKLASESMLEITQNVRRMYAISKGQGNVDLSMTSLNSAVEYILKLYSVELERKKIRLHFHFDKHVGLNLLVEPISFNNQVLGNIISNAIKFSPEGSDIFMTVYPVNRNLFTIEVKDNGIGIPGVLIDQLFDLNKKNTRPGTNGESGTGFGMHIMKSFVDMYGGKLVIESMVGREDIPTGTTIKLILKGEWN